MQDIEHHDMRPKQFPVLAHRLNLMLFVLERREYALVIQFRCRFGGGHAIQYHLKYALDNGSRFRVWNHQVLVLW